MATVNYTVTASQGDTWSGSFTVTNTSNAVNTELPTAANSPNQNFTPSQFANLGTYVTWRSVDISGQTPGPPNFLDVYPTTGYSFDIWSADLITAINANNTWSFLIGKTYNLDATKNTLIYNYNQGDAVYFARGGTISFS